MCVCMCVCVCVCVCVCEDTLVGVRNACLKENTKNGHDKKPVPFSSHICASLNENTLTSDNSYEFKFSFRFS